MNKTKSYFYLPNAEFLFLHNKDIFKIDSTTARSQSFKQLEISKNDFICACENPLSYATPSLFAFVLGMIYPFKYKLYFPIFISLLCLYLFNATQFPVLFGDAITTQFVLSASSLISLYFIFSLYSKAMWIRQVYHYLDQCYKANKKPEINHISLKFKPHNLFFSIVLGFGYSFCLMYAMLWFGSQIYLIILRLFY